jgi:hypothetical protein
MLKTRTFSARRTMIDEFPEAPLVADRDTLEKAKVVFLRIREARRVGEVEVAKYCIGTAGPNAIVLPRRPPRNPQIVSTQL